MRILFLLEGTLTPSSRFRVKQFIPYFQEAGIHCTVRSAYGDRYNQMAKTNLAKPYKFFTKLRRILYSFDASRFDLIFIQRPTFPFTSLPERFVTRINQNTIFDVDDAIWHDSKNNVNYFRKKTFDKNVTLCRYLICGNDYLAAAANKPNKTRVIPTVIDSEKYTPGLSQHQHKKTVIGWMGTASNFISLKTIVPALLEILKKFPNVIVRLVSNDSFLPLAGHPQVQEIVWNKEDEVSLLRSFDIGLMPLIDNTVTKGKCGFKMIQYMAVGVPVIVSPIGANISILDDQKAGLFASTKSEWIESLALQINDSQMRKEMGETGRARAVKYYSIKAVLPEYLKIFELAGKK